MASKEERIREVEREYEIKRNQIDWFYSAFGRMIGLLDKWNLKLQEAEQAKQARITEIEGEK